MKSVVNSFSRRVAAAVLLTSILAGYTSCTKPTPAAVVAAVGGGSMSAKSKGVTIAFVPAANLNGSNFTITGVQTNTAPVENLIIYTSASTTGTYTLNFGGSSSGNAALYSSGATTGSMTSFRTDSTHIGILTITTLDMTNKTMSGSFSFIGKQSAPTIGTATDTISAGTFAGVKW
jgi:hypothetical protein